MDPQQELFTELRKQLMSLDVGVYDGYLPPAHTPYPFIYIADSQLTDTPTKPYVIGEVYQTVHVWHDDPHKRGTLSDLMLSVKSIARRIESTNNFTWLFAGVEQQILPDNTTNQPLMHGVLELRYQFT